MLLDALTGHRKIKIEIYADHRNENVSTEAVEKKKPEKNIMQFVITLIIAPIIPIIHILGT